MLGKYRVSGRSRRKVCYSLARRSPKKRIKLLTKNTRKEVFISPIFETNKKIKNIQVNKVKKFSKKTAKVEKQITSPFNPVLETNERKNESKPYKKSMTFLKTKQATHKSSQPFSVETIGRKSNLFAEPPNLADIRITRRNSALSELVLETLFKNTEDGNEGKCNLRNQTSNSRRVTRSSCQLSLIVPDLKTVKKKRLSSFNSGTKNSPRLSTEPKRSRSASLGPFLSTPKAVPALPIKKMKDFNENEDNLQIRSSSSRRVTRSSSSRRVTRSSSTSNVVTPNPVIISKVNKSRQESKGKNSTKLSMEQKRSKPVSWGPFLSTPASTNKQTPDAKVLSKSSKPVNDLPPPKELKRVTRLISKAIGKEVDDISLKIHGNKPAGLLRSSSSKKLKGTSEKLQISPQLKTNFPIDDIILTPALSPVSSRNKTKKKELKPKLKPTKRKLSTVNHVESENLLHSKKKKKSEDEVCIANSSSAKSGRKKSVRANQAKSLENHDVGCASGKSIQLKEDCLTAESFKKLPRRKTEPVPSKYKKNQSAPSGHERQRGKSTRSQKIKQLASPTLLHSTPIVKNSSRSNLNTGSQKSSLVTPNITKLQIDQLPNFSTSSTFQFGSMYMSTPAARKKKVKSLPLMNELCTITPKGVEVVKQRKARSYSKEKSSPGGTKRAIPAKGTLKRARWVRNTLKEKNDGYEDDIFESKNFESFKAGFLFDDESDTSSVNIATPKFGCLLTPALPKKTPRYKDCISPAELLKARKNAEEYLYRRNKKRKSGNTDSTSASEQSITEMDANQRFPEKKKLEFEKAINTLVTLQKGLEKEAEGDIEEDPYFSDVSM